MALENGAILNFLSIFVVSLFALDISLPPPPQTKKKALQQKEINPL